MLTHSYEIRLITTESCNVEGHFLFPNSPQRSAFRLPTSQKANVANLSPRFGITGLSDSAHTLRSAPLQGIEPPSIVHKLPPMKGWCGITGHHRFSSVKREALAPLGIRVFPTDGPVARPAPG